MITLVATENIPMCWTALQDDFSQVIKERGSELDLEIMHGALLGGEYQLWIYAIQNNLLAWAITSISQYPSVKRLRFILLGGQGIEEWLKHMAIIEHWATKYGCTEAEAWVRPGLRKRLEPLGYKKAYDVVVKKLERRVES